MTLGEIYNANKKIYDKYAKIFIQKNISEKGDFTHRPFEMMTHFQRTICEKIDNDNYLIFEGFVENTEYDKFGKIISYKGKKVLPTKYNLKRLIEMFAFEIAINPNSEANLYINNYGRK